MEIWHSLEEVPEGFGASVATLGNFDGVHRGHQAVLTKMVADAADRGLRSIAMTFDPHPQMVHYPENPPILITGLTDKLARLEATGLDAVLVVHYTLDFAHQTPDEFVHRFFAEGLNAKTVVIGRDVKFGRDNVGDLATMRALGDKYGFSTEVIPDVSDSEGQRWSSTLVRQLLNDGDPRGAAAVLGVKHRLRGTVVHGDAIGREIGFPTANIDVASGMIPRHGVYAGWLTDSHGGSPMPAAVSIGHNLTVGGTELRVEAFVLDADGLDLYGQEMTLDLVARRRDMLDFGSMDALVAALKDDVEWCRNILETP